MKVYFILLVLCVCGLSVSAQITQEDLVKRYGEIKSNFVLRNTIEIRPDVLMSLSYTGAGQISEIRIEPKRITGETIDKDKLMPRETAEEIFKEVVPPELINDIPEVFSLSAGRRAVTIYNYRKIKVTWYYYRNSKNISGVEEIVIQLKPY